MPLSNRKVDNIKLPHPTVRIVLIICAVSASQLLTAHHSDLPSWVFPVAQQPGETCCFRFSPFIPSLWHRRNMMSGLRTNRNKGDVKARVTGIALRFAINMSQTQPRPSPVVQHWGSTCRSGQRRGHSSSCHSETQRTGQSGI